MKYIEVPIQIMIMKSTIPEGTTDHHVISDSDHFPVFCRTAVAVSPFVQPEVTQIELV